MSIKPPSLREELKKILTPHEQKIAIYGFDILGDMALIEIPDALQSKAAKIARTLLDTHSYLTRVYEKVGTHSGKYRIEKIRWRAGRKDPVATAKEWGALFRVHPGEIYYSSRLGTERQRIIEQFKPGQSIVVFFAGVGPYAILAAKHAKPKRVLAIEWNPRAIPFLQENIRLNKVEKIVEAMRGDVGKMKPIPEFDHVVMPGPDTALDYLPIAIRWISKKGGLIHVYSFVLAANDAEEMTRKVHEVLKNSSRGWKIVSIRRVNDFSPTKRQVCAAIRVEKQSLSAKKRTIKKT